jgi:hypothetical protein
MPDRRSRRGRGKTGLFASRWRATRRALPRRQRGVRRPAWAQPNGRATGSAVRSGWKRLPRPRRAWRPTRAVRSTARRSTRRPRRGPRISKWRAQRPSRLACVSTPAGRGWWRRTWGPRQRPPRFRPRPRGRYQRQGPQRRRGRSCQPIVIGSHRAGIRLLSAKVLFWKSYRRGST